jgi:hypothetical protein
MNLRTGLILTMILGAAAADARAHCDTWSGPVVTAAREAIRAKDVTPALKWIEEADEAELRKAFEQTMTVRAAGGAAEALADRFFFETLVRLHRTAEGAPYTGLKSDSEIDPAAKLADTALETGDADAIVKAVEARMREGLRERLSRVRALRPHAGESVAAGRRYVAAYVEFIHYVDAIHAAGHGGEHK